MQYHQGLNTHWVSNVQRYNSYYYYYSNPVVIPYQMPTNPFVHQQDSFNQNGISLIVDDNNDSSSDENDFNAVLNWPENKQLAHDSMREVKAGIRYQPNVSDEHYSPLMDIKQSKSKSIGKKVAKGFAKLALNLAVPMITQGMFSS